MPKSTKKQKDKAADFSKAKLKLGKGKKAPSNAVDTSFKARSIALPTQSIAQPKDWDKPATRRKLTFDDLIAQLKHYNTGTRKDAILGLRELFDGYPTLIHTHLTSLVTNCTRLIADEDASVRRTLLSFLGWLLPQIPQEDLMPHSPVLLLFTTSAQTHIFPEIRIDAIRFLDLFLEHIPDIVTEGWAQGTGSHGRRVLEGYLGVLNAGTTFGEGDTGPAQATSTASVVLSSASKLVVLKSLSSFLNHALSSSNHAGTPSSCSIPTWFMSSSFASTEAFEAFDSLLRPTLQPTQGTPPSERWTEEADIDINPGSFFGHFTRAFAPINEGCTLQDLSDVDVATSGQSSDSSARTSFVAHLARTLHPTLVSTFLDCAPTVFSPSSGPPETELQMVQVVGEICRCLYGAILREPFTAAKASSTVIEDLTTILGYFSPYFPFTAGGSALTRRDIKVEQAFQDLNLIYCELTSYLVLAAPPTAPRNADRKPRHKAPRLSAPAQTLQVARVSGYVVQLLRGEASAPSSLARPVTPAAYSALLPTIWSLLNGEAADTEGGTVLRVVVEHAMKAGSTSLVKRCTIDFLGRLVLLEREAEYVGAWRVGRAAADDGRLGEWLLHLAQTLWELGANNLPTTETILRLFLRLCQRRSPLVQDQVLPALHSRMVPYFIVNHPMRGKLLGPFSRLPSAPLRRLVLDVVTTLKIPDTDELEGAVSEAVAGTEDESYWISLSTPVPLVAR
ncbi:hypothetical protein DAEQUDRAFT_543688 [Daedalea quercina L-15889]|uniref:Pre-rRNA-processing protein n=1 Tax=Daedalea quercina L-15889 TaxID=1314783 RepID=A0A165T0A4_9APHY|nr:hypothetical protein DAEQUDRAFT_543688 [Daedalea quercina L-15889]